ncbi:hypothetical protein OC846_001067 [Tilletia horrida]|uniref:Uncharacterized protein n=1 Tax=Tilletia horrida TaxID=155126 RepID=A0AAN6GUQ6_9BASI|nr:hypothetical protein OC846_001067 [Tilletia horrida]
MSSMEPSLNVYDRPLEVCGTQPVTGFFRNGKCEALDAWKAGDLPREAVPTVKLDATHKAALRVVDIADLEAFRHK